MEKKEYIRPLVELIEGIETDCFCYSIDTDGEHEEGNASDAATDENLLWEPMESTSMNKLWQ